VPNRLLTTAEVFALWRPTFNAPSAVIPFVFVEAPSYHTISARGFEAGDRDDCARCQWAVRRGALQVHVMKRGEFKV
jgi:hypothetical protein